MLRKLLDVPVRTPEPVALGLALSCIVALAGCGSSGSSECTPGPGTGTVSLDENGLPDGIDGAVTFTGPTTAVWGGTRTASLAAGGWRARVERFAPRDPFVRGVYNGIVTPDSFCLASAGTQSIFTLWTAIPTSNTLWALNANGMGQLVGFRSARLAASATVAADVLSTGPIGRDLTFDREGNVWALGPTTAEPTLNRVPAAEFKTSGLTTADRELNLDLAACIPLVAALAFDPKGNLYLASPCLDAVLRIDAEQLAAEGVAAPRLSIPVRDPNGLAFDDSGNLWVASRGDRRVLRYSAAQLGNGSVATPTLALGARASDNPMDMSLHGPAWLAFDASGGLWVNDFAANQFYRLSKGTLARTGSVDVDPDVRITIGVAALLEGFAFDEAGGLWSAASRGSILRLAPDQLRTSSGPGAPTIPATILRSPSIGSAGSIAFYPAPAGLPLYHRLP